MNKEVDGGVVEVDRLVVYGFIVYKKNHINTLNLTSFR